MKTETKIEWATFTFNMWRGCTKVSAGCAHCYADTLSKRNPGTLGIWGPNGTRVVASEAMWREPVKWNANAEGLPKSERSAFTNPLGNLRTLGLIDYPQPGRVVALPMLFLEGGAA